ncbi:MAG: hypothetical protein D6732_00330 [Methanobacteriota archaeon]|nr:MAG: hypothetical protein D6732_00330 [Euryarchaeota archaeon]
MVRLWPFGSDDRIRADVTFLNLETALGKPTTKSKGEEIPETVLVDDTGIEETPLLDIPSVREIPEIPIIGIGGAGARIVEQLRKRFLQYGINYDLATIETDKDVLSKIEVTRKLHIGDTPYGTAKQFRKGATIYKKDKEKIEAFVETYLNEFHKKSNHNLVFLILGAGGTGVGVSLELADFLISKGLRPVPILVLPSSLENTRTKFIAAAALYHFTYAPGSRSKNLVTVLIDNDEFFENNSKYKPEKIFGAINERIGAVLADLITITEVESDGYSSDLNEFIEIFRGPKGIATLASFDKEETPEDLVDLYDGSIKKSLGYPLVPSNATRGYIFIQAGKGKITASSYRNLFLQFSNKDFFHEYKVSKDAGLHFRAFFVGNPVPDKLKEFMRAAEDVRVYILNEEINNSDFGKVNPKIDKLNKDEEIEVKAPKEIAEELAREATKIRRGEIEGDH